MPFINGSTFANNINYSIQSKTTIMSILLKFHFIQLIICHFLNLINTLAILPSLASFNLKMDYLEEESIGIQAFIKDFVGYFKDLQLLIHVFFILLLII